MVRGLATKPARIGSDTIYIRKAKEFLEGAGLLAEKEKWNASAVLSVHAVISACDAVCSGFLQLRHGGADHMQAVELLNSLPLERSEIESKLKQARKVISMKNAAEYEDKLIIQSDAQEMQKEAGRLVEWAEKIVK
ncbi:MAG: HEPN domain-containing protein [Candidatus Methanoperedens sp.]|nr:HEPN domain-containing protein [Candidatus Methanoperedens sp.]